MLNSPDKNLLWEKRFDARIRSWIQNFQEENDKDYHTGYVLTISINLPPQLILINDVHDRAKHLNKSYKHEWEIVLRYKRFVQFYEVLRKYTNPTQFQLVPPFPSSSIKNIMIGVDDNDRNYRKNGINSFLEYVLNNPTLFTEKHVLFDLMNMLNYEKNFETFTGYSIKFKDILL